MNKANIPIQISMQARQESGEIVQILKLNFLITSNLEPE